MEKKNEERRPGPDRRRFLRTAALLGTGLALGATSCGQGEQTPQTPNATPKAPKEIQGPAPPTTAAPSQNVFTPQPTRPYTAAPDIAPADTPSGVINVALIGCGLQGSVLLDSIHRECRGVRFKAVCDISPYNLTRTRNLLTKYYRHDVMGHGYEDYREMLAREKDLDAVVIATPDWMHAEQTIACAKAGLQVYCETPISHDLGQAREMIRAAREAGVLLQIGQQRRSNPTYRFACERLIRNGTLFGPLTSASACWNRSILTAQPPPITARARPPLETLHKYGYASFDEFSGWRWYRKYSGGDFSQLGAHQIDVLSWFLDTKPTRVTVNGGRDYWGKRETGVTCEWYDNVYAIYEFPTRDGIVRAQYQMRLTTSFMRHFESFMGTQGMLSLSEDSRRCWAYPEPTYQCGEPFYGGDAWVECVKKGDLVEWKSHATPVEQVEQATRLSDFCRLYRDYAPPPYCFGVKPALTFHGPHLNNFFDAIRGPETLNCPGEVAYACAVQVLKVNQLLDAGQDSGKFEERDFKV